MKIIIEFESLTDVAEFAKELLTNPEGFAKTLAGDAKTEAPAKTAKLKAAPAEKEVEPEEDAAVNLRKELKELTVKLADADREAGVTAILKKFDATRIKEIEDADLAKAVDMLTKMDAAEDDKYKKMLAQLTK